MNLKSEIRTELWDAISQQYEEGHYTNAILAAFYHLRDAIRNAADVDGDGIPLIGQAFGGTPPRLRINKFETESQKDEQKGFEQILRGLFQGIRNPRTHDQVEDKKDTADAIIIFVNYIVGSIQKARGPFVLDEWITRVFDPDFVESERYAQLLIQEVPPKRRTDTLLRIYQDKMSGDGSKLRLVFHALIKEMGDDKLRELIDVVSKELKTTSNDKTIRFALQILPDTLWPKIDETARLRIENKLIREIETGKVNSSARRAVDGALGTWATNICRHFALQTELYITLLKKLESGDPEQQDYVALYFWSQLPFNFDEPLKPFMKNRWIDSICRAITAQQGSIIVRQKLLDGFLSFPEDWRTAILERLKPLEIEDPEFFNSLVHADDLPF